MMQVHCGRCGAQYQFDAAQIPADGYQAQCSHCEHEFFVAPSKPADEQERAAHIALDEDADATPGAGDKKSVLPKRRSGGIDALFGEDFHDGPNDVAKPPGGPKRAAAEQGPPPVAARHRGADIEQEWARAPLAAPGEPSVAPLPPGGADAQAEAAAAYSRMRRSLHREGLADTPAGAPPARTRPRTFVGIGIAVVVGLGVVVGVVQSKSLHAPTQVTPPVRIVRDPSPEARAAFDDGILALRRDTATGLAEARARFLRAIAIDAEYTDAWAGLGLAAWLTGIDARDDEVQDDRAVRAAVTALTNAVQAQGRDASAVHLAQNDDRPSSAGTDAALALAASSLRMRAAVHDLQSLHDRQSNESRDAWQHLHAAGAALLHAAALPVQTPLLATTMALWLTDGPEAEALVAQQLTTAEQLVGQIVPPERRSWLGPNPNDQADTGPATRAAPWAAWRLLARSRLASHRARAQADRQEATAAAQAVSYVEAALRLEPDLRRAQMALAEALVECHREREAMPILMRLAQGTPPHERAQRLLGRLEQP